MEPFYEYKKIGWSELGIVIAIFAFYFFCGFMILFGGCSDPGVTGAEGGPGGEVKICKAEIMNEDSSISVRQYSSMRYIATRDSLLIDNFAIRNLTSCGLREMRCYGDTVQTLRLQYRPDSTWNTFQFDTLRYINSLRCLWWRNRIGTFTFYFTDTRLFQFVISKN